MQLPLLTTLLNKHVVLKGGIICIVSLRNVFFRQDLEKDGKARKGGLHVQYILYIHVHVHYVVTVPVD